ncbi:hypothetical protein C9374_006001 [Naegleria lovaniensis]|uniref:Calcineurin-like phosphoesterase domain-containing protein n=1 Tax=Naegleria lovaniensis TaxID=51637 RepID=A0AA88GB76_NAELO|nr:uncharacterized protein C9374_014218 [Naegleria lovaniensis]XP_044547297.1 uncharacterized protein C9374_006001 [Naegleria lovaniensis]KAG2370803.1 hypothetical protein C9374_014218 [Naegleria lovaniensis]KAG2381617.1 hypothetical protein C9374_006001 [Naegleria lovaniensis]
MQNKEQASSSEPSLKRKLDEENVNNEKSDSREHSKKLKESSSEIIQDNISSSSSSSTQPERLSILIMSDIHNYDIYFERVRKILDKNQVKVDIVLCPGDIVNIKTKEEYKSKEFQLESLKNVEKIAQGMLSFAPKAYLIPGNHDPDAMFENKLTQPNENIHLIHNSIVELREGLYLAGFGGSVPSFHISPPELASTRAWKGYPHSTDEAFGNELSQLIERMKAFRQVPSSSSSEPPSHMTTTETPQQQQPQPQQLQPQQAQQSHQFIFMTHNGPANCDTTLFQKVDITSPKIISGSDALRGFIEQTELQSSCVCLIHGHTHLFRPSSSLVGTLPIVNPGSLMEGNFSVIQLERQTHLENGPFLLESVTSYRFKP